MTNPARPALPPPLTSLVLGAALVALLVTIVFASGLFRVGPANQPSTAPTLVAQASLAPAASLPSATGSPSPSASPFPTATAPASASLVPTLTPPADSPPPSASSPPTATPTPTPTPSAAPTTAPQSRFRRVDGFPAAGEQVQSITAGGPGFVAVGYAENSTPECPDRLDGRIWTSVDGEHWTRQATESLAEARIWGVVNAAGTLYALGYVGQPGDCPVPDGFGNNVWRSTDGLAWEQITSGIASQSEHDRWNDVTVAGSTLVVVGYFGEAGDEETRGGGVWTSTDGVNWEAASRTPGTYEMVSVAALGSTVVAFGQDPSDGLAWYSHDAGRTWRRGAIDSGYLPYAVDVVAAHGRFVAVTQSCCGLPQTTVGVALVSTDGREWSAGTPPVAHRSRGHRALAVPDGFLALTDSTETRLSADGADWRSGPPGPQIDPNTGYIAAAAAGEAGVVMVVYEGVSGERVVRAWFAPASEFRLGDWTQPAQPAESPVIGESYPYELYTHCGTANTRVLFAGSVWLMDESTLEGRFGDPGDRGRLTQLSADRAFYESRRGGSAYFDRTDAPPPWPRCA